MTKQEVLDAVNWKYVMVQDRDAGGHEEVMRGIWQGAADVVAEWIQDDWQGEEAFAYRFQDGTVAVVTDYFGSCSGCDSWDGASNADATAMITAIVTSARLFPSIAEAIVFCREAEDDAADFSFRAARNLVSQLEAVA